VKIHSAWRARCGKRGRDNTFYTSCGRSGEKRALNRDIICRRNADEDVDTLKCTLDFIRSCCNYVEGMYDYVCSSKVSDGRIFCRSGDDCNAL
jgi:hypothetical protein